MLKKIIRILSILFIVFISLFALDVFNKDFNWIALVMNLIPTYITIILTIISWKKEFWGGILWIITAMVATWVTGIDLIITAPMLVIGGFNLWASKSKKLVK